jgi:hypothetical protein
MYPKGEERFKTIFIILCKLGFLGFHLCNYSSISMNIAFFFLLDFGLSWLTSLQFIQYHVAGFYKPTIPQVHPPICRITAHATMPGSSFPQFLFQALIQMNGA